MRVHVTQDCIIYSSSYDKMRNCPVALALKRAGFTDVLVNKYHIRVDGKSYLLSDGVTCKIARYDIGLGMQPFGFNLKV